MPGHTCWGALTWSTMKDTSGCASFMQSLLPHLSRPSMLPRVHQSHSTALQQSRDSLGTKQYEDWDSRGVPGPRYAGGTQSLKHRMVPCPTSSNRPYWAPSESSRYRAVPKGLNCLHCCPGSQEAGPKQCSHQARGVSQALLPNQEQMTTDGARGMAWSQP